MYLLAVADLVHRTALVELVRDDLVFDHGLAVVEGYTKAYDRARQTLKIELEADSKLYGMLWEIDDTCLKYLKLFKPMEVIATTLSDAYVYEDVLLVPIHKISINQYKCVQRTLSALG